ncbi:DUF4203 domain-containing protein [Promicromonospora iranensis]|jgi:hypothetical protein|uniref:DUF4203 domain-containing protein n=1 Tax=Promicromonospora iranensis TaxID=1105144 RepID=UPI0023A9E2DB|nr:DUF4203 domain-containing protein [Promicromonospora iranensis]
MSALAIIVVGLVLCLAGSFSIRLAVLAAGFGVAWTLAVVFDADTGTTLLISLGGAVLAFALTLLASRFLFFIAGLCVGAVIGAKLFVLVRGGGADLLLLFVVVPAAALASALLARRFERAFLLWGTAFGGAALVLSGVGRLWAEVAGDLWRPASTAGVVLVILLWVVLAAAGYSVQRREPRK